MRPARPTPLSCPILPNMLAMKTTVSVLVAFSFAATLSAQGLTTATGYADFANAGNGNARGVPAGTSIGRTGLQIRVADGGISTTSPAAGAATDVQWGVRTSASTAAVHVTENGRAMAGRNGRAAAGTSNDPRQGTPGAHGLGWALPAPAGTKARVLVYWRGAASSNASTGAAVDADGDGTADFTARISGGRMEKRAVFNVVAGARGFRVGIVTSGLAAAAAGSVSTAAGETYHSDLNVALHPEGSGGPTCNFRPFGPECGGKLQGRAAATSTGQIRAGLSLTGAAPNALAALVIGGPLPSPVQLPGSRCSLLVNPRVVVPGRTDGNGAASWGFPFSPAAGTSITIAFQAITVSINGGGVSLASSNGLGMDCQ